MSDKPFPDGLEFYSGVVDEKTGNLDPTQPQWSGIWSYLDGGMWSFAFQDEVGLPVPALTTIGRTPKEAVSMCVRTWCLMNGGPESPLVRQLLAKIDNMFNEDGSARTDVPVGGHR